MTGRSRMLAAYLAVVAMALPWHAAAAQSSATPQSPAEPRIAFVKIDVNDLDAAALSYCKALQMQDIGRIHSKRRRSMKRRSNSAIRPTARERRTLPESSWYPYRDESRYTADRTGRRRQC